MSRNNTAVFAAVLLMACILVGVFGLIFAFTVGLEPNGKLPAAVALVASALAFGLAANAILRHWGDR